MNKNSIIYLESTDSTMIEAKRFVGNAGNDGPASGTVIWAGHQSAGKGRVAGRRWESAPGEGLLFTVIYRSEDLIPMFNNRPVTILPLLCGLAVIDAVIELTGPVSGEEIRIKWPNDLVADGKKLCGILCESSGDYFYCGIGININQFSFPEDLRRPGCSLRQLSGGAVISTEKIRSVIQSFLNNMEKIIRDPEWRKRLNQKLYKLDEKVLFKSGPAEELGLKTDTVRGTLSGISDTGALIITTEKGPVSFVSGELVI